MFYPPWPKIDPVFCIFVKEVALIALVLNVTMYGGKLSKVLDAMEHLVERGFLGNNDIKDDAVRVPWDDLKWVDVTIGI